MSTYYAVVSNRNELYHHGVKGMKWGVHKQILTKTMSSTNRLTRNVRSKGVLKGAYQWHAENVSKRLNSFDSNRKSHMSNRQKQSYENSKNYWNQKAKGVSNKELKAKGEYRGIIRRTYDSHRSRSLDVRAAKYGISATRAALNDRKVANTTIDQLGVSNKKVSYGQAASQAVINTAVSLGMDELLAKISGHY